MQSAGDREIARMNADSGLDFEIDGDGWVQLAQSWIESRGGVLVSKITETQIEILRGVLSDGIASGKGIDVLAAELRDKMGGLRPYRARRIARTEVLRASNVGQFEGGRALADATGTEWQRVWNSFADARSRPHHAAMLAHPPVDKDDPFTLSAPDRTYYPYYPQDATLPASESVNCRCVLSWIRKQEETTPVPA